jgi:hypothetical protein
MHTNNSILSDKKWLFCECAKLIFASEARFRQQKCSPRNLDFEYLVKISTNLLVAEL